MSTPLDMMSVGISDQFIIQRRQSSLIQLWQSRNLYMIYFAAIYLSKLSRTQRSHDQDQSKRNHWRHNNASNLFTAIYFFFVSWHLRKHLRKLNYGPDSWFNILNMYWYSILFSISKIFRLLHFFLQNTYFSVVVII